MPHVGGGGGDDLASSDEIKVFKDEGDDEKEGRTLTELKSSLVTEGEERKDSDINADTSDYGSPKSSNSVCRPDSVGLSGKVFEPLPPHPGPIGYVVSPYHNGSLGPMPMATKVPIQPHPGSPISFMVPFNGEHFAQPPPAHMGIPPVSVDPKTGIPRPPVYHIGPPGQYPPVFNHDFTHHMQWHSPTLYPATSPGFRSAYSTALPVTTAALPRFSPSSLLPSYPGVAPIPPHPSISHHALLSPGVRQDIPLHHHMQNTHRNLPEYHIEQKCHPPKHNSISAAQQAKIDKKNHIKKPLNAFMLYMKEMRAKVVAECTLKESAAINQILGRRWHSLSREEQAKYYEMARKERQLHMQLYPGWSARDNYAQQVKKKKRKKDRNQDGDGSNLKKCRARYGLDQQSSWCKPCRRKKKCIRYMEGGDNAGESEDNMGSAGSVEAPTPDSKCEDDEDVTEDSDIPNFSPEFILGVQSPPEDRDMEDKKPILDRNGVVQEDRSNFQHFHRHHPLSVHQLIQPHINTRLMLPNHCDILPRLPTPPPSTESASAATSAPPMLIVK